MRPPNQLIPILAGERDSLAVSQLYPNLFPFLKTSREKVGAAIRYDSIIFHNNNNTGNESRRSRRNSASTTRSSVEPRPRVRRATLQSHAAPPDAGGPGCLALRRPTRLSTESRCRRLSRPHPVSRGTTEPSATPPAKPPANACLVLPLTFRFRTSPAARAYRRRPGWPTFHPPRQAPLNSLRRGAVCGPPR